MRRFVDRDSCEKMVHAFVTSRLDLNNALLADLPGYTMAKLQKCQNIAERVVMPPSHRMRGATAVLIRHKPHWHHHDRRSSAVVPSLIAVPPPKTVKTADLRGGTAETFNMFRRASAVLYPRHTEGAVPLRCLYDINRSGTAMIAVVPQ